MLLFFLPQKAVILLWLILFFASAGLLFVLFNQLIQPYYERKESGIYDPAEEGDRYTVVVDELAKVSRFRVGKKTGELTTRCSAISEDHLDFLFKKNRDAETYDIIIKKNGNVLVKPPRMDVYSKMESVFSIESHEIIGHTAQFRISDRLQKDRMVNYIELSLGSEFFFTKMGQERMRFIITITGIQPGINSAVKNKDRVYPFGKGNKRSSDESED